MHTNPCGVASRENILEAYKLAVKADPVSAFGGIVAFNVEVDEVYRGMLRMSWQEGRQVDILRVASPYLDMQKRKKHLLVYQVTVNKQIYTPLMSQFMSPWFTLHGCGYPRRLIPQPKRCL